MLVTNLIDPNTVKQIQEAIQTLNLNINSETAAQAAKWIALYLIGKELLVFLGKIAAFVFIGWLIVKLLTWSTNIIKGWISENTKVRLLQEKNRIKENILEKIDWEQMKEALDAWYHENILNKKKQS